MHTDPEPGAGSGLDVVDVAFALGGESVPAEHALPLWEALAGALPWLADEALAGVHPLRGNPTAQGTVLLAQRARLVLRIPAPRLAETLALEGTTLEVAGSRLVVGAGRTRALVAATTLSSSAVTVGDVDAETFQEELARQLAALALHCEFITGRRRVARAGGREIAGYSVVLHGLAAADAIHAQQVGLGAHRTLGWGIFVPAKAITIGP
jgi:CRISPR-associated protein Cas6